MSFRTNVRTPFAYVKEYPSDLAVLSVAAALCYLLLVPVQLVSELRLLVALPLVLFLPGYAFIATLFPTRSRPLTRNREVKDDGFDEEPRRVDVAERIALSFALSIAVVPLVVIALPLIGWPLSTESTAAGLVVFTILFAQLAAVRRLRLPNAERFSPEIDPRRIRRYRADSGLITTVSTVILVFAILFAGGALVLSFVAPLSGGGFTELAIYTTDDDGELVSDGIGGVIEPGESVPLVITVENNEGEYSEYTVIVQEQVIEDGDVVERNQLHEIDAMVGNGATGSGERNVTPTAEMGETVRISVLLYADDPPSEPTNENADEDVYFWVTITDDPSVVLDTVDTNTTDNGDPIEAEPEPDDEAGEAGEADDDEDEDDEDADDGDENEDEDDEDEEDGDGEDADEDDEDEEDGDGEDADEDDEDEEEEDDEDDDENEDDEVEDGLLAIF